MTSSLSKFIEVRLGKDGLEVDGTSTVTENNGGTGMVLFTLTQGANLLRGSAPVVTNEPSEVQWHAPLSTDLTKPFADVAAGHAAAALPWSCGEAHATGIYIVWDAGDTSYTVFNWQETVQIRPL